MPTPTTTTLIDGWELRKQQIGRGYFIYDSSGENDSYVNQASAEMIAKMAARVAHLQEQNSRFRDAIDEEMSANALAEARVAVLEAALTAVEWIGECPVKRCTVLRRFPNDVPVHWHCPDCEVACLEDQATPDHERDCTLGQALHPQASAEGTS